MPCRRLFKAEPLWYHWKDQQMDWGVVVPSSTESSRSSTGQTPQNLTSSPEFHKTQCWGRWCSWYTCMTLETKYLLRQQSSCLLMMPYCNEESIPLIRYSCSITLTPWWSGLKRGLCASMPRNITCCINKDSKKRPQTQYSIDGSNL